VSFGFDRIDRAHRPKPKIVLECVDCPSTTEVVIHTIGDQSVALCRLCYQARERQNYYYDH
jgi:hypothetical protein